MTNQPDTITPPPELVEQWLTEGHHQDYCSATEHAIAQAARWGSDQELEACCEWMDRRLFGRDEIRELRAARRPKPPSLKEQALETLRSMQIEPCWINGVNTNAELMSKYDILRRALEALDG